MCRQRRNDALDCKSASGGTDMKMAQEMARSALCVVVCLLLACCAVVPPESARLSATVGQQLAEIRKSHLAYIDRTYALLEAEANRAVDNIYGPKLIAAALKGASGATLMAKLEAGKNGGDDAKTAVRYVGEFLTVVRKKVEAERARVVQPIMEQRAQAMANANAAWTQVIQGNITLTAHLESLSRIRDAQDQLLAKAGLENIQDKTAAALTDISDELNDITIQANDREADLGKLENQLQTIVDKLKAK
jgi:hypothetical protein